MAGPKKLSDRQEAILRYIQGETGRKGYPPSVREIGDAVGLSSSSTVHGHLDRLEEKGFIRRDPTKPRAIELLGDARRPRPVEAPDGVVRRVCNVPLVGRVTAGVPILAEQNIEDYFPLPADFVRHEESFLLTVRGESMLDAGILDGDYVLVRQQSWAENGDIVVALLGDEATVKRYFKERDHIRLQPENSAMEPILTREALILGKVTGLFRQVR